MGGMDVPCLYHTCRILIFFLWCSTTYIITITYKKLETYFALFIFLDFCTVCLAWIQLGIKFCLLKFFRHLAELAVKDHKKIFLLVLPWYSWHVEHLIFAEEPKFSGLVNLSRQLAKDMPCPTWKKCNVLPLSIKLIRTEKFVKPL